MREIACIKSYVEDDTEYWSAGVIYNAVQHKNGNWNIMTNLGTKGAAGPDYMLDNFEEHFTTNKLIINLMKAGFTTGYEYTLNRKWLYSKSDPDEIIGETNFTVPIDIVMYVYMKYYSKKYGSFNEFLETYTPETEGMKIYRIAREKNKIIKDSGNIYY